MVSSLEDSRAAATEMVCEVTVPRASCPTSNISEKISS